MKTILPVCLGLFLAAFAVGCKSKKKPESATEQNSSISSDIKDRIDDAVEDKVRKKRLMHMIDTAEACINEVLDVYVSVQQKMDTAPDLTREDAQVLLEDYIRARTQCIGMIVDNRVAMRGEMNAEEWALVFPEPEEDEKDEASAEAETSERDTAASEVSEEGTTAVEAADKEEVTE